MFLLFALLAVGMSAAYAENSVYFMNTGKSDKVDIYVRIFVPTAASPKNSVGHYDLMIKGKLYLRGAYFTNPVFSYRTDGSLAVFSAADTGLVYPHSKKTDYYYANHMYYYHISVKGLSSVYTFLSALNGSVKSVKSYSGRALKCKLKGKFSTYKVAYVNCYLAVAKWVQVFGNDGLMNYYYDFYQGNNSSYLPSSIVSAFGSKLKKVF